MMASDKRIDMIRVTLRMHEEEAERHTSERAETELDGRESKALERGCPCVTERCRVTPSRERCGESDEFEEGEERRETRDRDESERELRHT